MSEPEELDLDDRLAMHREMLVLDGRHQAAADVDEAMHLLTLAHVKLAAITVLHRPLEPEWSVRANRNVMLCTQCDAEWPCPTTLILDGAAERPQEDEA